MKSNRNHEGYMDITACEAIRRASRDLKPRRTRKAKATCLVYRLGEVKGFDEIAKGLRKWY